MAKVNPRDIKSEIEVFLRNSDIISVATRGVTTQQDTGTFSGANSHTLATTPTLAKNVRNVNVDSSDLTFGTDYTVNYATGVISFTSSQTGDYVIDYDTGTTDHIFSDFPQPHIKISDFPRIGFDIIDGTTDEIELGAGSNWSGYTVSIVAYDDDKNNVESLIATIREKIMDNKKNFYYFPFITPKAMGPLLISPFGANKIKQRNQDCNIRFVYED